MKPPAPYCGRFAPSPTGPLHFGSLIAAVGSFLDARAHGGRWLLRIDDLDPPREMPGAAAAIMRCLESHGLYWDDEVTLQSRRADAYEAALGELRDAGLLYACDCSRSQLPVDGTYFGHCRRRQLPDGPQRALRIRVPDTESLHFEDRLCGSQQRRFREQLGDFVVRRRDHLYAYHLAVVVDDADAGITDVVRGRDLLDTTAQQIYLQRCLRRPTPRYAHLPLATHANGQKLSKQNHAPPLDVTLAVDNLRRSLVRLGQPLPPADADDPITLLGFATAHWDPQRIPAV